jgi:hypothetical protein
VVCALLFDDAMQDFLPYARTELIIDSQSHKYQRRIVFRIPRNLSRQIMILVSYTHARGRNHQCTQPTNLRLGD